jgi:hypothetical protein
MSAITTDSGAMNTGSISVYGQVLNCWRLTGRLRLTMSIQMMKWRKINMAYLTKAKKLEHEQERQQALKMLQELLPPSTTVYTILTHVSRSGLTRRVRLFAIDWKQASPSYRYSLLDITYWAALVTGHRCDDNGLEIGGTGFDAQFEAVAILSRKLYPQGFDCTGDHCPSNEHRNGDHDRTPHHHESSGYALRQQNL